MDVKGIVSSQQGIARMLKSSYQNNRLSHAYLFYGEKGVGKKEMAYYFATMLYCKNSGCLECHECQSILNDEHMNVHYVGVLNDKKLISKNQIDALQEEFAFTSLLEGARIYIIDGIDTASIAAQNSLLKFIEEPVNSESTYGIFIADDVTNVISTIRSRCINVYFPPLPHEYIRQLLLDNGLKEIKCYLTPYLSNSVEESLIIAKDESYDRLFDSFQAFLALRDSMNGILFLKSFADFFNDSKNLTMFFHLLTAFYENMFTFYSSGKCNIPPLEAEMKSFSKRFSFKKAKENLELILKLESRIDSNCLAKNIMHELIVGLFKE